MMIIAPNSPARKGGKERGGEGEYGGMMIAPNSRARKEGKEREEMKGKYGGMI